jgi:hypothetical protein
MALNAENSKDKARFDKMKSTVQERGRPEAEATKTAAQEVKEMRDREQRSRADDLGRSK